MKLTTSDIGFAIRDYLEGRFTHHVDTSSGEIEFSEESVEIPFVDVGDADTPVVETESGQKFRIRIEEIQS